MLLMLASPPMEVGESVSLLEGSAGGETMVVLAMLELLTSQSPFPVELSRDTWVLEKKGGKG